MDKPPPRDHRAIGPFVFGVGFGASVDGIVRLPGAAFDDTVVVSSDTGCDQRTDTVVDSSDRDGEPFLRVQFRAT